MMESPIRVVVFDLGRVMIRIANGWEEACQLAGVPFRPFIFSTEARTRFWALEDVYGSGAMPPQEYFARLRALLDDLYTLDELQAMHQAIICEELPGIGDLVRGLNEAGLITACLSNTCATHWVELDNPERYPAIGMLHARHASHLLGAMKPNEEIYTRFEAAMGCLPQQMLFFDDRRENVDAAGARGWSAVWITEEHPAVEQMYDALASHGIGIVAPGQMGEADVVAG